MAGKTKEDRSHELRLLLIGSFITVVVGGGLTAWSQRFQENQRIEAEKRADSVRIMEQRREQATSLFDELSPLMDTRLYKWRQLAWALEDRIAEDSLRKRYSDYQEVFYQWNYNLNKNRALVCRFFGPDLGEIFERQITPDFIELHQALYEIYKMPRSERPFIPSDSLNSIADSLNEVIYSFNNSMAELIRSGQVGLTNPGSACVFKPE
jgi:hypothetical protein